jgi:hypothetical protein
MDSFHNNSNKSYHVLQPILKKSISQLIKICLYKAVITPIMKYGAKAWTLTDKMEKMLMTWERKILRKIYGPTYDNGHWRIKLILN